MKQLLTIFFITILSTAFTQVDISVVAEGLIRPVGIERGPQNTLLVAESGSGTNNGGITLIHQDIGAVKVIDSLPSTFNPQTNEIVGPTRAQMLNEQFVAVFTNQVPGPLESSILIYNVEDLLNAVEPLGPDDAVHQIIIGDYIHNQGLAESNPYTLVHDGCDMYIVDAAANAVVKRDGLTGVLSMFATFDDLPNTLPFGPPTIDAVPTRIIRDGEGFLVSSLTGFPFIDGLSNVYRVDMDGNVSVQDSNYTLVTDMALHPEGDGFYTLQLANFRGDSIPPYVLNTALIAHTHADGTRDTVATGFGPSPGFVVNDDGSFFVTHLFFGQVLRIDVSTSLISTPPEKTYLRPLEIYPNPSSDIINLAYRTDQREETTIEIYNTLGQKVWHKNEGFKQPGDNVVTVNTAEINGNSGEVVYVLLKSGNTWFHGSLVLLRK